MADDTLAVEVTPEAEPGLFDGFAIGARTGRFTRSTELHDLPREEAYAEINDEMFRLTGKRLPNPMTQDRLRVGGIRNRDMGQNDGENTERAWLEEMLRLTSPTRAENVGGEFKPVDPRVQALIARATPEAISKRAQDLMMESAQEGADFNKQFGIPGMLISGFGDLGGNIAAGDPTAIAGSLAAIGGAPVRTVIGTFVKDAAINGLGSAVGEYATAVGAREMGQPYTFKDFLTNTAIGIVVGGTIGVVGRTGMDVVQGRLGVARPGGRPRADTAPAPDAPDIADTPTASVENVAAAVRAAQSNSAREAATTEAATLNRSGIEPDPESYRVIDESDEQVREFGPEPEPAAILREPVPEETASAARIADDAPAPEPGAKQQSTFRGVTRPITFEQFKPSEVGFDPAAFQYKKSAGAQGQTGTLEGVQTFDPVSSGKVLVFERGDGTRFVADGHQRLALAQRAEAAGQAVTLDGYLYREADGFTADDVRQIAAQKNLREGAGDPLDVANILREAPDLLDASMPLSGAVMRTGRALSRLTDETLGAVRNGLVSPEHGAVIARVLGDAPELQMAAVKQFMDDPPRNEAEATFIAREMLALPAYREQVAQIGLFGDQPAISGVRERHAILAAAQKVLSDDARAFGAADRFAADLEAAGNVLDRDVNARRNQASKLMLKELFNVASKAGPVADVLRRITANAIEKKTSAKVAGQQFADEVLAMLNERGLLALKTGAPVVQAPPVKPLPLHESLPLEVRAAEINHAQNMDDAAMDSALAEAAVERAMRGEQPPEFAEDALGMTPESDLANIDRALADMEALGEQVDPTVREAAAAFLASPDQALNDAARARLAPTFSKKADPEAPRSHTAAVEGDLDVEAPFQPLRFKDEAKLLDELKWVTMPELAAIAREFDVNAEGSRAEVTAAILKDWRQAQPDPEPVASPAPPPAAEVDDLTKRAIRFAGRDDAKLRSDDAMADLVASVRNMPNADAWLARQIEDSADDRRIAVMRQVRETLKSEPRFAIDDETLKKLGSVRREMELAEVYYPSVADAMDRFAETSVRLTEMAETLKMLDNGVPSSILEPIQAIQKGIEQLSEKVDAGPVEETLRLVDAAIAIDGGRMSPELRASLETLRAESVDEIASRQTVLDVIRENDEASPDAFDDFEEEYSSLDEAWLNAHPDLGAALKALADEGTGSGHFTDAASAMESARGALAKIRRNVDELWDEWQGGYGKRVDEELAALVEKKVAGWERAAAARSFTDDAINDLVAAFDNGIDETQSLRSFSRPKGVRFADAPRGWATADAGPVREILNTPASLQKVIEKRFGKKIIGALMERGKLNIVATGADLPIFKDGGKFAMDSMSRTDVGASIASGKIKEVLWSEPLGDRVDTVQEATTVRYSVAMGRKKMNVVLDSQADGSINVGMNIDYKWISGGGEYREAADVFGTTIAIVRHDMTRREPGTVYRFGGGDEVLANFYSRVLTFKGVIPQGTRAFMRLPDGAFFIVPDGVDQRQFGKNMRPVTKDTVFARDGNDVFGYHEAGQSYINASTVPSEKASAIVLHEIGVHAGMETMIGTEAWRGVLAEMERRATSGDFDDHEFFLAYKTAWDRSSANNVWEEVLAWGVTNFEELVEGSSFRDLIVRVIASVRAWLWREFPALRDNINLTMADYHALALGALRREAMAPIGMTAPMRDPIRTNIAEQQLADADRLDEIADMLKDCGP